jgi:hypothetical protein
MSIHVASMIMASASKKKNSPKRGNTTPGKIKKDGK